MASYYVSPRYPSSLEFTTAGSVYIVRDLYANPIALPPFKRIDLYLTQSAGTGDSQRTVSLPFSSNLDSFTGSETVILSPSTAGAYTFSSTLLPNPEAKSVQAGSVDVSRSYAALSSSSVAQGEKVTVTFYLFDSEGNSITADTTTLAQAAVSLLEGEGSTSKSVAGATFEAKLTISGFSLFSATYSGTTLYCQNCVVYVVQDTTPVLTNSVLKYSQNNLLVTVSSSYFVLQKSAPLNLQLFLLNQYQEVITSPIADTYEAKLVYGTGQEFTLTPTKVDNYVRFRLSTADASSFERFLAYTNYTLQVNQVAADSSTTAVLSAVLNLNARNDPASGGSNSGAITGIQIQSSTGLSNTLNSRLNVQGLEYVSVVAGNALFTVKQISSLTMSDGTGAFTFTVLRVYSEGVFRIVFTPSTLSQTSAVAVTTQAFLTDSSTTEAYTINAYCFPQTPPTASNTITTDASYPSGTAVTMDLTLVNSGTTFINDAESTNRIKVYINNAKRNQQITLVTGTVSYFINHFIIERIT